MNNSRKCPERMRTILQAMERSIEAARRSRMNLPDHEPSMTRPASPPKPAPFGQPPAQECTTAPPGELPRLKARPKRLDTPLINPFQQPTYRSQTG